MAMREHINRVTKKEAKKEMGAYAHEVDLVCQMMKAAGLSTVSMCRPVTGKTLWVVRANNGGFWYDLER